MLIRFRKYFVQGTVKNMMCVVQVKNTNMLVENIVLVENIMDFVNKGNSVDCDLHFDKRF